MFLLRALVVWLVIIAVETAHGILRTLLLVPMMGDFPARQISVFTVSLLIFGVTLLFIKWKCVDWLFVAGMAFGVVARSSRAKIAIQSVSDLRSPRRLGLPT